MLRRFVPRPFRRLLRGTLQQLPQSWRVWLAHAAPSLPVGRPITEPDWAYDLPYWERLYAVADPWGSAASKNEEAKHARTLGLCGGGPFGRALEIGCGEGVFTQLLAPRCDSLVAVDISTRAVRRAQVRISQYPHVLARAVTLPAGYPAGPFDLVVASDVLYYWPTDDLRSAANRIEESLAVGGRFVAIHYAPPIVAVSNGDTVHDVLAGVLSLSHVHGETRDIGAGRRYRIDVWDKVDWNPSGAGTGRARALAVLDRLDDAAVDDPPHRGQEVDVDQLAELNRRPRAALVEGEEDSRQLGRGRGGGALRTLPPSSPPARWLPCSGSAR